MTTRHLTPLSESVIRRMAWILGDSSAAARALAEYERRTGAGERVAFYADGKTILVGPKMPPDDATED